jgi:sulfur-oxidizing protein SoxZ
MTQIRSIVTLPATARRGETVEIRALVSHPMESGHRSDGAGGVVPQNILRRFSCRYGDETVFEATLHPAIAANPVLIFHTVATETAPLRFLWEGDGGVRHEKTATLTVT